MGILDGAGAFELDADTVRVLTNHELRPGLGYAYTLDNGTELSGAGYLTSTSIRRPWQSSLPGWRTIP